MFKYVAEIALTLRSESAGTFLKKIPQRTVIILRLFNYFWALPVLVVIRLVRPLVLIRFTTLNSSRIGHFTMDSCYYLATLPKSTHLHRTFHWFALHSFSCNQQWFKMISRKLYIRSWVKYFCVLNQKMPGGAAHVIPPLVGSRPFDGMFQKDVPRFEFLPEENKWATQWLEKRGWKLGEPFICLLIRDPAYLQRQPHFIKFGYKSEHWDYHNYRDTDSDTYSRAVEYLVSKGFWVVRMGQFAEKPLKTAGLRVIDYPFVNDQNDLMDIWLTLNCKLFISNSSGLDILLDAYNKAPSLIVNGLPLWQHNSWHDANWYPKNLRWKHSKAFLTLEEHLQHGYMSSPDYAAAGIDVVDLTPEELLLAVTEQIERMTGSWIEGSGEKERQDNFWRLLKELKHFHLYHGWIHPNARVCANFLKQIERNFHFSPNDSSQGT